MLKITIKVGSNVLTGADKKLNVGRMECLAGQIAKLCADGHKVILVSSGAMAAGRGMISGYGDLNPVAQRQLLSSVGQVKLIDQYKQIFDRLGIKIGQLLVTKQDLGSRTHYLNMKNCFETLWQNDVIPVVNENDAVSLAGLMFTDNDELSGLIASMMDCDRLIILSNIDGIYDGDPSDASSHVIREVANGTSVSRYVRTTKSDFGRGGMVTKCRMAQKTAQAGIDVYIANGAADDVLTRLVGGDPSLPSTHFEAGQKSAAVKKWIAYSDGFATARIIVNKGAAEALQSQSHVSSLLPVGVREFEGDFRKDDIVLIVDPSGTTIGVGRAAMDKETAARQAFAAKQKPLVHYDYLYVYPKVKE